MSKLRVSKLTINALVNAAGFVALSQSGLCTEREEIERLTDNETLDFILRTGN